MKANFLNLNGKDFLKGAIVAVLTAILATLTTLLQTGTLFDKASLPVIGTAALSAFIAYLGKNLFTNSQGQFAVTEKSATPEIVKPIQNQSSSNDKYPKIHSILKILILAVFLSGMGLSGMAQTNPWSGFFKPLSKNQLQGEAKYSLGAMTPMTHEIKFRPQLNASFLQVDLKSGEASPVSSAGLGVTAQWYYKQANGTVINPFGVGLLALIGKETPVPDPVTLLLQNKSYATFNIALVGNIYGWVNIGPMIDCRTGRWLGLFNVSLMFKP
jgi:hypothetical protein